MRRGIGPIALLALTVVAYACTSRPGPGDDGPEVILPAGGPIDLVGQDGRPFSLADHRGKVLVVFFGYTSCPDYCPSAMARLSRVTAALGPRARDVLTVFVSVDPDRDTPEILGTYVGNFSVEAVGLTGTREAIDDVVRRYGATYEIVQSDSAMGPLVHHSTQFVLVGRDGALRRLLPHETSVEDLTQAVLALLE